MAIEEYGAAMTEAATADFLESQGIGTLALGDEEGGYGIPMSFAYDRRRECCYLQFAFGQESRKQTLIEADGLVTLSTYHWQSVTEWQSALLEGRLEQIEGDEDELRAAELFADQAKIASPEVFEDPFDSLELGWYALVIEEQHGRKGIDVD